MRDRVTIYPNIRKIVCTLLAFICFSTAEAESGLSFSRIYTDDGLSNDSVICIVQDSDGFLWVGTSDGLNRYDGTNFRTFYRSELDLPCSYVNSICEDGEGNIWVGTDCGLTIYEKRYDRFRRAERIFGDVRIDGNISLVKRGDDGAVWVAVDNQGLFRFDIAAGRAMNYFVENGVQTLPSSIGWFCFDSVGTLWISLRFDNLYRADGDLRELVPYTLSDGTQPFAKDNVTRIIKGLYNTIYVACGQRGIVEIKLSTGRMRTILATECNNLFINDMQLSSDNILWAATDDGLFKYNVSTTETERFRSDSDDVLSLSDNEITSVFIDRLNGLWVGTYNGMNRADPYCDNFRKYYEIGDVSLEGMLVRGFAEDRDGTIWIATKQAGMFRYMPSSDRLEPYVNKNLPSNIFGVCYDDGSLWISSHTGICRLDIATGRVRNYRREFDTRSTMMYKAFCIYKNSLNRIYVGTPLGLLVYDETIDDFVTVDDFDRIFVYDIFEDSKGNMWFATLDDGLFKSDVESGRLINYRNDASSDGVIPSNKVRSVFEDQNGDIWITTHGAGACRLNEAEGRFEGFELFSREFINVAFRIVEDGNGCLWITTNKGLVRFRPPFGAGDYRIYTKANGLLNNEFDYSSGICTRNGDIYLGSKDGFIKFNPHEFVEDKSSPNIVITDFYVNDRLIKPDDGTKSLLKTSISQTRKIELSARDKNISFRISMLNLRLSADNTLYYRLKGFDDAWQKAAMNTVTFNNLPAGRYLLELKSVNGDGVWSGHHPVEIVVKPRFYASIYAIILYIAAALSAVVFIVMYLRKRTIEKHEEMQRTFEKNREIEIYNEKIEFLLGIAHEIKTPLTLISTPLDNIVNMGHFDEETREDLNLIKHNTERLSRLIGELLDFSKVEKRGFQLTCTEVDVVNKINMLLFGFSGAAKGKNLKIEFTHSAESIYAMVDEQGLAKIISNLLANAVKYAETYVHIDASVADGDLRVAVCNDGQIVPLDKRDVIFNPFVQYKDSDGIFEQGFGIGLTLARKLAELHSGTLVIDDDTSCNNFILTLPCASASGSAVAEAEEIAETQRPVLLLVEDDRDMLRYTSRKLKTRYEILTASDGRAGLDIVAKKHVDIIVTDISMPGMNGFEMCETLKRNFATSHIPIIILSALSSLQTKIDSMDCGADIYIEKPFSLEYLVSCIESLLYKRNRPRGNSDLRLKQMPQSSNLSKFDEEFLVKMEETVIGNISDPNYGIDQLSESLCLSKSTLNRKVRGLLNTTPNEYIKNMRLIVAAEMIREGSHRINEICYMVGFGSPSYFIKCFKSYFDKSPTEYKDNFGSE